MLAGLAAFFGPTAARADTPAGLALRGRTVASFTPPGYRLRIARSGDFNGDGIADHVAVFEPADDDPDSGSPRLLVVLLGERGGGLKQVAVSDQAAWPNMVGMRGESYFDDLCVRGRTFAVTNVDDVNGEASTITSVFLYRAGEWLLVRRREQVHLQYRAPEPPGGGRCRRVRTGPDESCTAGDRWIDYRTGRVTERWTIEAAQDRPPRPVRTASARWQEARQPLRRLEEAGDR